MAVHKASEGSINVGANAVAEVTDMSIEETADTLESTEMSDAAKSFEVGQTSWSGSLTAHWDETDTNGQETLVNGASFTLNFYPEGAVTGDQFGTGTALVTNVGVSSSNNGLISRSISFQGTGALTWGAVA